MPKYNKSQAIFSYDVPGSSLAADHDGIESVSWDLELDNSQGGTLGTNQVKNAYTGKTAGKGELKVVKDNTAASAYQDMMDYVTDATYIGTAFTVRIDSPDSEVGSDRIDLEIKLTGATGDEHNANSADPAVVTFPFIVDASISHTTIT